MVCPSARSGQIGAAQVTDFIGAPERIRTSDPQIRSLGAPFCLSQPFLNLERA